MVALIGAARSFFLRAVYDLQAFFYKIFISSLLLCFRIDMDTGLRGIGLDDSYYPKR